MLVELPFASFFSCKLLSKHGTDIDIHHLESLDPEVYRYYDSYNFSAFVLAPLLLMFASLYFFLATDINTISNVVVHENDEKGYVRRFHSLKAMRRRELEGYLTWHCFYVHSNFCLSVFLFRFVLFFSICFFLFFGMPRNLLVLKNYTGNVEDLSLNFTVVNNDLGESQVIDGETVNKKIQTDSAFIAQ